MSAIGSVIVMVLVFLLAWFPGRSRTSDGGGWCGLPARLGHAGQLAAVGHLAQADPAQAELAVDGLGPPTALATGVAADRELGLAGRLDPEGSLRHFSQRSWL